MLSKESGHYLWAKGMGWFVSRCRSGTELSLRESAPWHRKLLVGSC